VTAVDVVVRQRIGILHCLGSGFGWNFLWPEHVGPDIDEFDGRCNGKRYNVIGFETLCFVVGMRVLV